MDIEAVRQRIEQIKSWGPGEWSRYSDKQVQAILVELEEWDKFVEKYGRLVFFRPNPIQDRFFNHPGKPKMPRVRLMIGGNRCLGGNTVVDGCKLTIEQLFVEGKPFPVYSYDKITRRVVESIATAPFIKGHGTIHEVVLADGERFEATLDHRIMVSMDGKFLPLRDVTPYNTIYNPYGFDTWLRSIKPIREDNIYDISVPPFDNYICAGAIHANSGKTTAGVMEAVSFAHGERLWDGTRLPIKVPNRGRIIATSYLDGIKKVIEPKLKELIPVEMLKGGSWEKGSKIGQQGSLVEVRFANGSWFDLMSSEQDSMKHEGADIDWLWPDEPLSRDHWISNTRGLVDRGGYAFLTLTPLTEAWMKTELYDKATTDDNYAVAEGSTYDNVGFGLTKENVDFFKSTLGADEIAARIDGKFLALQGMVYKEYKDQYFPNGHLVKPFEIPAEWPRFVGIDPHDRTPTHILWAAVDESNDVYIYDHIAVGEKTIKDIAQAIKDQEFKQEEPGKHILRIIDPSAVRVSNAAEQGFNIQEEFVKHGIYCYPGNNDIIAGHKRMREYLKFETTLRGFRPRLFVFDSCREYRRDVLNYIYDDRSSKGTNKDYRDPKENKVRERDKHSQDCARYVMMWGSGPTFYSRRDRSGKSGYVASNETTGY